MFLRLRSDFAVFWIRWRCRSHEGRRGRNGDGLCHIGIWLNKNRYAIAQAFNTVEVKRDKRQEDEKTVCTYWSGDQKYGRSCAGTAGSYRYLAVRMTYLDSSLGFLLHKVQVQYNMDVIGG